MRKIIIIQHCQSEHHINELSGGWTDTPLTELGRKQAKLIGERLEKELNINEYVLYSSDFKRTKQTAEMIKKYIGLDIIEERGLREINNGVAAGKTKVWAKEHRNPQEKEGFDLDYREWDGGETWREFYQRISQCMNELWNKNDKNLILVTHGCALSYIIAWWMKFDASMLAKVYFKASPGSITLLLDNQYKQHALRLLNDVSHLSELKSTSLF